MSTTPIRTRFAPSPTGVLHIGGVRTALFNWLFARHHGGEFILRIEDTDRERSTQESVDVILEGMRWLGLDADEEPVFQSRRTERYREVAAQMLQQGLAYHCYCTPDELAEMRAEQTARGEKPRYDGRCRASDRSRPGISPALRFINPADGQVVVDDIVHGRVVFENSELDDLVIMRSDQTPTYHFSVVVDDADMRITHVIRGDDHLNNTPRQMNMLMALGFELPRYAHLPMIAGPDGAKLSKRHGSVNVLEYREQGYLPEAMLNYLVRLGWAHGDQEIFSTAQMIELFDLSNAQRSSARLDPEKLDWLNQHYIKEGDVHRLAAGLAEQLARLGLDTRGGPPLEEVVVALRERAKTLREMADKAHCYYEEFADYEPRAAAKFLRAPAAELLGKVRAGLAALDPWDAQTTQGVIEAVAASAGTGLGQIAQPVRVAVTGGTASPGIGVTLALLGRERTLGRLERAIATAQGNG